MFHTIPQSILDRMATLEAMDAEDRTDGTERLQRLRQIPPLTGRFLATMAALAPEGGWVEIGTSAGYSTLWLALAARERGRRVTTFELLAAKAALARETFAAAAVNDVVDFHHADALEALPSLGDIAFCFLDAEKEIYAPLYDLVVPKLVSGGLLIADNAISHGETLGALVARSFDDRRVDAQVLPIGTGELVCRKL